jgi:hypothetical protein
VTQPVPRGCVRHTRGGSRLRSLQWSPAKRSGLTFQRWRPDPWVTGLAVTIQPEQGCLGQGVDEVRRANAATRHVDD